MIMKSRTRRGEYKNSDGQDNICYKEVRSHPQFMNMGISFFGGIGNVLVGDPYYYSTYLLLHGDGVNNSTSFPDNSWTTKTLTAFGTPKISTTQSVFGGASMYFDGSASWIRAAQSSDFQLFGNDSTVEFWVYYPSSAGNQCIIQFDSGGTGTNRLNISLLSGTSIVVYTEVGASNGSQITATAPSNNVQHHIAMVRSGSTILLYVDGIKVGSTTTTVLPTGNLFCSIGSSANGSGVQHYTGYVDDLRITNGVARYLSNFTPPAAAYPNMITSESYVNNLSALLHFNGTNGSTSIIDQTGKTWTISGAATISTAQSKFGGSSLACPGTSINGATTPSTGDFDFGSGDFTIEFFVRFNVVTANCHILAKYNGSTGFAPFEFYMTGATSRLDFYSSSVNASWDLVNAQSLGAGLVTNTWYHMAVTRSGNTWRTFQNGGLIATTVAAGTVFSNASIVTLGYAPTSAEPFNGYIDDLRITKGVARYLATFPNPTVTFPDTGSVYDRYLSAVSLLLDGEGTNGSSTITDTSNYPSAPSVRNANTLITTSDYRFGSASIATPAVANPLAYTGSTNLLMTGDFTFEASYKLSVRINTFFFWLAETEAAGRCTFYTSGTGDVRFNRYNSPEIVMNASTTIIPVNVWFDFAVVRTGSTLIYFLNGASIGSSTDTSVAGTVGNGTGGISFLYNNSTGSCLIDNVRITKNVARYTASYPQLTAPFPAISRPGAESFYYRNSLVLNFEGTNSSTVFTDDSYSPKTPTRVGTPTISTAQSKVGTSSCVFNGTTDALTYANNVDLNLALGDFTIETWAYINSLTNSITICQKDQQFGVTYPSYALSVSTAGAVDLFVGSGNGTTANQHAISANGLITTANWIHIAATRSGTTLRVFVNGAVVQTATQTVTPVDGAKGMIIGQYPSGGGTADAWMNGYLDGFRITKGVARYTAAFTPSTASFINA